MKIINGIVFNDNAKLVESEIQFQNGKITEISDYKQEIYDAKGYYVIPGMIDIHIHGAMGVDTSDGKEGDLKKISEFLISKGVTAFLPTSMSYDEEKLIPLFKKISNYCYEQNPSEVAEMLGINMEGPYINVVKAGAQKRENIKKPNVELFNKLWDASGGKILLLDLAPEEEGAGALIKEASKKCKISIAHSNATYLEAQKAFKDGVKHVTHLFNAMSSFNYREPGIVGAAIEDAEHVELICDGIHVHPAMIRNAFKLFGEDRICLISDSMRAAGMKDGEYSLGGQKVVVENDRAVLENGKLAGSITNLQECLKNVIEFGISIENAVRAVTMNPAKAIGVYGERGSLTVGKIADIAVLNKDFQVVSVFKDGKQVI